MFKSSSTKSCNMNGIHRTIQISVSILIALNVQKVSLNDVFIIICQF